MGSVHGAGWDMVSIGSVVGYGEHAWWGMGNMLEYGEHQGASGGTESMVLQCAESVEVFIFLTGPSHGCI